MKSAYQAETGHQIHGVMQEYVNDVKQPDSPVFDNILSKRGEEMRLESSRTMDAHSQGISQEAGSIQTEGTNIERKVGGEQGRNVTTRVVEKVVKEGRDTVNDLKKAWNNTGNDLSKISGEPQQK